MHDTSMWGMGWGHFFWIVILALFVAALVKFVFFR
jgi:hypothetical protein